MAKKSRMSVLKRQREARKAEKAAVKRERREQRRTEGLQEPTRDDLAAYLDVPGDQIEGAEDAEEAKAAEEPTGT